MKKTSILLFLAISMLVLGCSSTSTKLDSVKEADIYVEYDGGMITKADYEDRISMLPEQQRESLNMAGNEAIFLERLAQEQAFYMKANELGLDKDPEVLSIIDQRLKQYYLNEYYEKNIRSNVKLTDQNLRDFYDNNQDLFVEAPVANIRYIQVANQESADKVLADLKKGISFDNIAAVKSINTGAKQNGNVITGLRNNGYIQGIGNDTELDSLIFNVEFEPNKAYGPYETATGIHFFSIIMREDAKQKDFEAVKSDVKTKARVAKETDLNDAYTKNFMLDHNLSIDSENLAKIDFMNLANNNDIIEASVITSDLDSFNWTVEDVLTAFNSVPRQERMFITQNSNQEILDHVLSKEIYFYNLKAEGFDKELNEQPKYKNSIRTFLLTYAYKKLITDTIEITDADIEDFYQENKEKFAKPGFRKVEILNFASEEVASQAYDEYIVAVRNSDTKKIKEIMEQYAINSFDKRIADKTFRNGIVPNFGRDNILSEAIWNLPVNEVSDITPVKRGNNFAIFRTLEETPKKYKELGAVIPQIQNNLTRSKSKEKFDNLIDQYMKEYNFVVHQDKLHPRATADELFALAEKQAKLGKFKDTILYYQQIVNNYQNGKDDYKAMFMIAFTQSEYVQDKEAAIKAFEEFIEKYPQGELNDDATYMLKELKGEGSIEIPELID